MATVYAVQAGDWSDTSTWDSGTVPGVSDDVYTNGFDVTIDESIVVNSLTNKEDGSIAAGGKFIVSDDISMSFSAFEPEGLTENGLIEIIADCELFISGEITSGETDGNGIYIGTNTITAVSMEITSITAKGDDSSAIFANYGTLTLTVNGDVKASELGTSKAIVIDDAAELELTTTGDILARGATAVEIDSGSALFAITGGIVGGTATDACGVVTNTGPLTIAVSEGIEGGTGSMAHGVKVVSSGTSIPSADAIQGGSGPGASGFHSSSGNLTATVTSSVDGGSSTNAFGIYLGSGDLDLDTMMINAGSGSSAHAIFLESGDLELSATYISGGSGTSSCGVRMLDGAIDATVISLVAGNGSDSCAVFSSDTAAKTRSITSSGAMAEDGSPAVRMVYKNDTVITSANVLASDNGTMALQVPIVKLVDGELSSWTFKKSTTGTTVLDNETSASGELPAESDVRAGTIFGGVHTGTLEVPSPKQVSHGVPIDHTIGQAALNLPQVVNYFGEQIRAAFNLESGIVFIEATVYHGSNANYPRPDTLGPLIWVGSVEPLNALDHDGWLKE